MFMNVRKKERCILHSIVQSFINQAFYVILCNHNKFMKLLIKYEYGHKILILLTFYKYEHG